MNQETTWLLAVILTAAGLFLTAGIWGLVAGMRRLARSGRVNGYEGVWLALLPVLFSWLVYIGLQASGLLGRLSPAEQEGLWFYWRGLLLPAVGLGLVGYLFVWRAGRAAWRFIPGDGSSMVVGALCGLGLWLAAVFAQRILAALIPTGLGEWVSPFQVGLLSWMPAPGGIAGVWVVCILLVGLSPLVEEFFFRGYLLPLWSQSWGQARGLLASSLASAVFALNLPALPVLFLVGLGLGVLARYSRTNGRGGIPGALSLHAVWAAHTIFNLSMVAAWLWRK